MIETLEVKKCMTETGKTGTARTGGRAETIYSGEETGVVANFMGTHTN